MTASDLGAAVGVFRRWLQSVIDEETGEVTGTETVPNPVVVKDDAERTAAQAAIDGTPQEVVDFAAAEI